MRGDCADRSTRPPGARGRAPVGPLRVRGVRVLVLGPACSPRSCVEVAQALRGHSSFFLVHALLQRDLFVLRSAALACSHASCYTHGARDKEQDTCTRCAHT